MVIHLNEFYEYKIKYNDKTEINLYFLIENCYVITIPQNYSPLFNIQSRPILTIHRERLLLLCTLVYLFYFILICAKTLSQTRMIILNKVHNQPTQCISVLYNTSSAHIAKTITKREVFLRYIL